MHGYTYDSENRLVSVDSGSTASYAYDQQNRRYKKTVGGAVTHYIWEGSQVLAEHNGSTGAAQVDYIRAGNRLVATGGGGAYYLSDRLSVRATLNSSGTVIGRQGHLPFGEDFGESGSQQKQHFTSYERDSESGNDYAVNRSNAAGIGRFMQADPYKASGRPGNPQSWNRYAYTRNNPVNRIDQLGLDDTDILTPPPGGAPGVVTLSVTEYINREVPDWSQDFGLIEDIGLIGDPSNTSTAEEKQLMAMAKKLIDAFNMSLAALDKADCKSLFNLPNNISPAQLLKALMNGTLEQIVPGVLGSITIGTNSNADGKEFSNLTSAETVLLPANSGDTPPRSTPGDMTITINGNPGGPWTAGYFAKGGGSRYGASQDVNRAVSLIHELGHAAVDLFGASASQIVEDNGSTPDGVAKSVANSQRVFDACFKKKKW